MSADPPDGWNDVTAQYGLRRGVVHRGAQLGDAPYGAAQLEPPESGTHRIIRPRALGELGAERHLHRDALSSIVTEYLRYFAGPDRGAALRAVREALDAVGGASHAVPQALAGQLVHTFAHQLSAGRDREGFLATAWEILATTGLRDTA